MSNKTERAYKCSNCHEPGHNKATCTRAVGQVKHCSKCGGGGHNVRTCTVNSLQVISSKTEQNGSRLIEKSPVTPKNHYCCSYCDQPGHNVRTCGKKKEDEDRHIKANDNLNHYNKSCGKDRNNNVSTCESQSIPSEKKAEVTVKALSTKIGKESEVSGFRNKEQKRNYSTNTTSRIPEKNFHNLQVLLEIQSLKELERLHFEKKQSDDTNLKSKPAKQIIKEAIPLKVKCNSCQQDGHNSSDCPSAKVKGESKSKNTEYSWLLSKAQLLLETGPLRSNKYEGPGHIYIYQLNGSDEDLGEEVSYKIGRSINLPERRVKAQETANHMDYVIVKTFETPWNQLTEKVIHSHLDELGRRRVKPEGDGKTEWFAGKKVELIEIITKVIREVRGMWEVPN